MARAESRDRDVGWRSLLAPLRWLLERILRLLTPAGPAPVVRGFRPIRGCPGVAIEVWGSHFAAMREDNRVTVGGVHAYVVEASAERLQVVTRYATRSGPLEVEVDGHSGAGPVDFEALSWPTESKGEDGPPILITGRGHNRDDCDMPSTGDLGTLVVLCRPADLLPSDPGALRDRASVTFEEARTYYRQVSYGRLDLVPTFAEGWCALDSDLADLSGAAIPPQAADYAARQALGDSSTRDEREGYLAAFTLIISLLYTDGGRSFHPAPLEEGEWLQYSNPETDRDIELHNASSLWSTLLLDETHEWQVWAHEIGHCMLTYPEEALVPHEGGQAVGPWRWAAILGEDLYALSGSAMDASAARFDLMGSHSYTALFSAYYIEQLGYYETANIRTCSRLEQPELDQEFDVVAHGVRENADPERCHLVKIEVAPGLLYYVEVRQRPDPDDPDAQVFDPRLQLPYGSPRSGGVLVTKVFTGTVNMNQRMRFITAMTPPMAELPDPFRPVLIPGDVVLDPARRLQISFVEDLAERPLTCRVRVTWAASAGAELPPGDVALRITPWNRNYATPDIWINRLDNDTVVHDRLERRYDVFEQPELGLDPDGNMDRPRVDTRNEIFGRVHCDGLPGASISDVDLTYYVVTPPGVGDNGNWAPLGTRTVDRLAAGESAEREQIWIPEIDEHTCLKLYATAELPSGELLEASAQENVFEFLEATSGSALAPVVLPLAVRNPRSRRVAALISVRNVPQGFVAQFPHRWVWLEPLQERRMALTIIATRNYSEYQQEGVPFASVKVDGWIKRRYHEELEPGVVPPPCLLPMGGVLARVTPKRRVNVFLWEDQRESDSSVVALGGRLEPAMGSERVTVDLDAPAGRRRAEEVLTDGGGGFSARFDLRTPALARPGAEPDPVSGAEPMPGIYTARALVVSSPRAAQATSAPVYLLRA